MTATKLYDLEIDIQASGEIWLTQSVGCGENTTVSIHPSQLRYLAELTGLLEPSELPTQPEGLKKRLERLHDRLIDIRDDLDAIPSVPPGSGDDDPIVKDLWLAINDLSDTLDDYFPGEGITEDPSVNTGKKQMDGGFQLTPSQG